MQLVLTVALQVPGITGGLSHPAAENQENEPKSVTFHGLA